MTSSSGDAGGFVPMLASSTLIGDEEHVAASDGALVEELARVFWEPDRATTAARAAGVPLQGMPAFRVPRVFWTLVVDDARNGAVPGGVNALVEVAARQFPGNSIFMGHRARGGAPDGHGPSEVQQRAEQWQQQSRSSERELLTAKRGGVELVPIPGGRFSMGSRQDEVGRYEYRPDHLAALGGDPESPRHEIELVDFYLARTPVTNAQYRDFFEHRDRPAWVKEPQHWGDRHFDRDDQPVVGVSWKDAKAYCDWAGLMLPTEAQWEHACRAGTETRFNAGDREEDLARVGWYTSNSGLRLHAVAELASNAWGLHDMHGNVWEWCRDIREPYTTSARHRDGLRREPLGTAYRVVRGGSWYNEARCARSAFRGGSHPSWRSERVGFRPAKLR